MIFDDASDIRVGTDGSTKVYYGENVIHIPSGDRFYDIYVRYSGSVPYYYQSGPHDTPPYSPVEFTGDVSTGITVDTGPFSGNNYKLSVRGSGKNNPTYNSGTMGFLPISTGSYQGGDTGHMIELTTTYQKVYTVDRLNKKVPYNNTWPVWQHGRGIGGFIPQIDTDSDSRKFLSGLHHQRLHGSWSGNAYDGVGDPWFLLYQATYNTNNTDFYANNFGAAMVAPQAFFILSPQFSDCYTYVYEQPITGSFAYDNTSEYPPAIFRGQESPAIVSGGLTGVFIDITGITDSIDYKTGVPN